MNKYETVFILKPDLADEDIEAALDRLKSRVERAEGKVAAIDYWGARKLAYPVRYRGERMHRGFYILFTYLGDGETVVGVERNIKIMDDIFRYLTVKREGEFEAAEVDEIAITKREKPAPPEAKQVEEKPAEEAEKPVEEAEAAAPAEEKPEASTEAPVDQSASTEAESSETVEGIEAEAPAEEEKVESTEPERIGETSEEESSREDKE